jgi:hypothetical protein
MFIVYGLTVFLSAALILIVQPLCARLLLPVLGGTPAVWATCMFFFQAGLLLGYAYAHAFQLGLGGRWQRVVHVALLTLAAAALPFALAAPPNPPDLPALWLLTTLTLAVGGPYVLAASSGPLLQRWYADASLRDPYILYAASNTGSLLAVAA